MKVFIKWLHIEIFKKSVVMIFNRKQFEVTEIKSYYGLCY